MKVGFLGERGTFSEMAVNQHFKNDKVESCNYPDFTSILNALDHCEIDYAMIPVENTTSGIIYRTYDLLKDRDCFVVGEENVYIDEHLITLPGVCIEDIKEVHTHPEPIVQCQKFFQTHPWIKAVPRADTSTSVKYVKEKKDPRIAALASLLSAEYYNLPVLMKSVQDNQNNMTRFFCLSKKRVIKKEANKISMYFVVNHEPGALYKVIEVFAKKGLNMLKLESRPIQTRLFEYCFYIDFDGNLQEERVIKALEEVRKHCIECKVLGCYPISVVVQKVCEGKG